MTEDVDGNVWVRPLEAAKDTPALEDDGPHDDDMEVATPPFATLTPERVLDALEGAGLRCDGRLLALNSYENRVYQVGLEDGGFGIAKFYRSHRWSDAQILEEHRFVDALQAAEIPAVPARRDEEGRSLHVDDEVRFAIFDRRGGRAPDLESKSVREWLGRFVARIHTVGAASDFATRPTLDLESFGREPGRWIASRRIVPSTLEAAWNGIVEQALAGVAHCEARSGPLQVLRLHGDCHASNVLWTEAGMAGPGGPHFVDFDDARMGPAVQDLWMMLSGTRDEMTRQLADLLTGYQQFRSFDVRELHRLEALRTLRMIHYCAWIARRWDDPAFPAAFPFFGTELYWQQQILALREQVAAMDEPPLEP